MSTEDRRYASPLWQFRPGIRADSAAPGMVTHG